MTLGQSDQPKLLNLSIMDENAYKNVQLDRLKETFPDYFEEKELITYKAEFEDKTIFITRLYSEQYQPLKLEADDDPFNFSIYAEHKKLYDKIIVFEIKDVLSEAAYHLENSPGQKEVHVIPPHSRPLVDRVFESMHN
jgi:hypothetical protein